MHAACLDTRATHVHGAAAFHAAWGTLLGQHISLCAALYTGLLLLPRGVLQEFGATGNKGLVALLSNPVLANGVAGLATSATAQAAIEVSSRLCYVIIMSCSCKLPSSLLMLKGKAVMCAVLIRCCLVCAAMPGPQWLTLTPCAAAFTALEDAQCHCGAFWWVDACPCWGFELKLLPRCLCPVGTSVPVLPRSWQDSCSQQ